jgi:hypothetical protein
MKSLMETLMVRENPRNCCHRTNHQLRDVVNSTTDKPPAQGVHGCDNEPLMTALHPLMSKSAWRYLPQR